MDRIRISFISFLAYPLFNAKANVVFGGAEIDAFNLAAKLAENDRYDVTFYVGDFGQKHEEQYGKIKVRKFKYMNLESYTGTRAKFLRHWNIIFETLKMDADICFIEAYNEMLGWVALIPGRLKGVKTIFRLAHDLDTDLNDAKSKGFLYHRLYKYGISRADAVVSQTDIQRDLLDSKLGIDSQVIKNGFYVNEEISYEDKKTILWVARAQSWKRPELLIELAKRLPSERFIMIMPGENELQSAIRKEAEQLENLQFIDYVPFAQIQPYYDSAKLFVNTSEYEGFPNAFVQACLGKTPILSFNVNPDDFIGTNQLGHFCRDELDNAVQFIRDYTPDKMRILGANALEYVKCNHDIARIAPVYEEIIQKLISAQSDPKPAEHEPVSGEIDGRGGS